jgi:hypothetical protein
MSAIFRIQFCDTHGRWWCVRVLSTATLPDSFSLMPAPAHASLFISEAEAWACAAKFNLEPGRVSICPCRNHAHCNVERLQACPRSNSHLLSAL